MLFFMSLTSVLTSLISQSCFTLMGVQIYSSICRCLSFEIKLRNTFASLLQSDSPCWSSNQVFKLLCVTYKLSANDTESRHQFVLIVKSLNAVTTFLVQVWSFEVNAGLWVLRWRNNSFYLHMECFIIIRAWDFASIIGSTVLSFPHLSLLFSSDITVIAIMFS